MENMASVRTIPSQKASGPVHLDPASARMWRIAGTVHEVVETASLFLSCWAHAVWHAMNVGHQHEESLPHLILISTSQASSRPH